MVDQIVPSVHLWLGQVHVSDVAAQGIATADIMEVGVSYVWGGDEEKSIGSGGMNDVEHI